MRIDRTGYIVEYSERVGFTEGYGDTQKAIVSSEYLAKMLQNGYKYYIGSAHFTRVETYQENHDEKLPELGF